MESENFDTLEIDLGGRHVLVTGGSRGIGREIARWLGRAGAHVTLTARNETKLLETVALVESEGCAARAYPMEVTDADAVDRVVDAITKESGPVDLLVNNAGVSGPKGHFWETDPEEWWKVQEVNLKGVMLCCRKILPGMLRRGSGRIINVASNAGVLPIPEVSGYCVSKAAVLRFTDTLAAALDGTGIPVFAVSPGLVLTDMTQDLKDREVFPASAWSPIEDIGRLCLQLASGRADALSGRYIHASADDLEALIQDAEGICREDRYVLRLKT